MKRKLIKITAAALAIIMLALPIASCSAVLKPAVSLGKNSISVGMYSLMASILKGSLAYGNSAVNGSAFWDTVINKENGQTNEEFYNEVLLESAKNNLYKLALFDEKGLTLPNETVKEIDEDIEFWIDYDGEGSRNKFNEILAQYGANVDILRDYMIMSAKIDQLVTYLYGNGAKIGDSAKQQYLDESYVRIKQIFFPYYEYLYEVDDFGDEIYYYDGGNKICYDKDNPEATVIDSDGDGKSDVDKNGDIIWYIDDDKGDPHISYDKVNGERKPRVDEKGNQLTEEFNKAEQSEIWNRADSVLKLTQEENFSGFEALMLVYDESYGDDSGDTDLSIYLNRDINYSSTSGDDTVNKLTAAAAELSVGEITRVETDYGVHIIMRYENEDGAWDIEENAGYFEDETGIADFDTLLINYLFSAEIERVKERLGDVAVDTEAIAGVSIKNIGINYDFY